METAEQTFINTIQKHLDPPPKTKHTQNWQKYNQAQTNEILAKALAHNILTLIHHTIKNQITITYT